MMLSNYKCMHIRIHIRIQNSRILIQTIPRLTKLFQYSTVHSNRIESNSINSTIRNRLLLQVFISEMFHVALQSSQRLPETAFYTKKSKGFFKFYILHSTWVPIQNPILHAEGKEIFEYIHSSYKTFQRHSSHKTFQRHSRHSSHKTFQGHSRYSRHSRHSRHSSHS